MLSIIRRLGTAAVALAIASHLAATLAHAEVSVEESDGVVHVEARDSSIAEILQAVGASYDAHYRQTAELDRPLSGIFEGSLSDIVSRLLEGHDYVATVSETGQIEIVWIRLSAPNAGRVAAVPRPVIERATSVLQAPNVKQQLIASPRIRRLMAEHAARLQRERASSLR